MRKNIQETMKKVLITGANSYIGESFAWYVKERHPEEIEINVLDMRKETWRKKDFSGYNTVFHVAGIAHADSGIVSKEKEGLYYKVNRDLAIEAAKKAKKEGVRQFIFMSSMLVYGSTEYITKETKPNPVTCYGNSKWQAETAIRKLEEPGFFVAILRAPMIYGKGCKGNYPVLAKMAGRLPVFPNINNKRSLLYIEHLCELLYLLIKNKERGIFCPQNREQVSTSEIVRAVAQANGHAIWITSLLSPVAVLGKYMPGSIGVLCKKAFRSSYYELGISNYKEEYRIYKWEDTIIQTEQGTGR